MPTLLSLLQKSGIFINAVCGGKGKCGRCRILIKGRPRPPDEIERLLIPEKLIKKGYRLACRYKTSKIPKFIKIQERKNFKNIKKSENAGLAIDIGTTVIKGAIVDLNTGMVNKTAKIYNPQNSFGGDVISRISLANEGKYSLLKKALREGIRNLKILLGCVRPLFTTVAGNPVMLSFYLGKPVKCFGYYPFRGEIEKGIFIKNPPGYVFGTIGGFVGGDTIAGILASGLLYERKPSLYIDLGTNGEIVLLTREKIYALSTAAGPAFEGIGLSCGSLAIPGAIERVFYNNGFNIVTIDNKTPIGFCASGFIDLLATLLKLGWLTPMGVLKKQLKLASFNITNMDIRKLQLGIGAIHTGVKFLIDYTGIKPSEIKMVIITGEFGSHLNIDSLKTIGIIPTGTKNIRFENDLPLKGAIYFLKNKITPEDAEQVRRKSIHLELAVQKDFQKRFIEGLILKPWN